MNADPFFEAPNPVFDRTATFRSGSQGSQRLLGPDETSLVAAATAVIAATTVAAAVIAAATRVRAAIGRAGIVAFGGLPVIVVVVVGVLIVVPIATATTATATATKMTAVASVVAAQNRAADEAACDASGDRGAIAATAATAAIDDMATAVARGTGMSMLVVSLGHDLAYRSNEHGRCHADTHHTSQHLGCPLLPWKA